MYLLVQIVKTIGNVMETKSKTINVMLMNVARHTARQFAEHIKKKILVVDDSNFMLEVLQQLLGADYAVQTF